MPTETNSLGTESAAEARQAVAHKVAKNPALKKYAEEEHLPYPSEQRGPVYPCPQCATGKVHCWGRTKLPDGRLGFGSLFVCDSDECNYFDKRLS